MSLKHRWLIIDDSNSIYRTNDKERVDVALDDGALALDLRGEMLHYGSGPLEREAFEDLPDDLYIVEEDKDSELPDDADEA